MCCGPHCGQRPTEMQPAKSPAPWFGWRSLELRLPARWRCWPEKRMPGLGNWYFPRPELLQMGWHCWPRRRIALWMFVAYCARHCCWPPKRHWAESWRCSCFGWPRLGRRWFELRHWPEPPKGKGKHFPPRHWAHWPRLARSPRNSALIEGCCGPHCGPPRTGHWVAPLPDSWIGWFLIGPAPP